MVQQENYSVVQRLVSVGINALTFSRLMVIAADGLQVEGAPFNDRSSGGLIVHAVPRQAVVDLIHQLQNEAPERAALRRAILADRMACLDAIETLAKQSIVLGPMFKLDEVRLLRDFDFELRAIDQSTEPAAMGILAAAPSDSPTRFAHVTSAFLAHGIDRYLETEWRVRLEQRAVVIALAARLYRSDLGRWPATLNELTPHYLPAVPEDPFATRQMPMSYAIFRTPTGAQRPMIYSDNNSAMFPPSGSASTVPPGTPMYSWDNRHRRQWRDLSLPTFPATGQ